MTVAVSDTPRLIPGLGVLAGDGTGPGEDAGDLGLLAGLGEYTGDLGLLAGLGEYTGDLGLPASHMMYISHAVIGTSDQSC